MRANRSYELSVRGASRGPGVLADPGRLDQVEVVEIASGEVVLFWDSPPSRTGRLVRALRADLAGLEAGEFLARWRRWDGGT